MMGNGKINFYYPANDATNPVVITVCKVAKTEGFIHPVPVTNDGIIEVNDATAAIVFEDILIEKIPECNCSVIAMYGSNRRPKNKRENFFRWGYASRLFAYIIGKHLISSLEQTGQQTYYVVDTEGVVDADGDVNAPFSAELEKILPKDKFNVKPIIINKEDTSLTVLENLYVSIVSEPEEWVNVILWGHSRFAEIVNRFQELNRKINLIVGPHYTELPNYVNCGNLIIKCFSSKYNKYNKVNEANGFVNFAEALIQICREGYRESKGDPSKFTNFLKKYKFYPSSEFGTFFFRDDGELFFPLYIYDSHFRKEEIATDSITYCHNGLQKEIVAEQLVRLADLLEDFKSTDVNRRLKPSFTLGKLLKGCCETIGDVYFHEQKSQIIQIDFISKHKETIKNFYHWNAEDSSMSSGLFEKALTRGLQRIFNSSKDLNFGIHELVEFLHQEKPIQINLKESDLEDNDAYRLYIKANTSSDLLPLHEWWANKKIDLNTFFDNDDQQIKRSLGIILADIDVLVVAKSNILASQVFLAYSKIANANLFHSNNCTVIPYNTEENIQVIQKLIYFDFILYRRFFSENAYFLYYIPETESNNEKCSGITMLATVKLTLFDLQILTNVVSRVFVTIHNALNLLDVQLAATKSAIGSIMSRNGSHNIGSHVLAALSHNVGTMPDDRVLYQYIQHRMDYIATATTEFPIWKQPTKIVGDVFKTFLSQYHLLNYISGSEGLKAYQFQNPNIDLSTAEQGGTIRVHIRRIDDDDDGWIQSNLFVPGTTGKQPVDFIVYPTGKEMRLDKDVEIAIPGGVIGQHAIYTIIENILRNAAKHEWSNLDKADKEKCHLDLFVDFKDRPVDGIVEFVVWTCNEKSPTERANGIESDITISDIYEKLVNEDKGAKLDLAGLLPHQQLQVKVSRPFIASNGQLHKENWGLAEMRISAGFLNTVDIGEIGGVNCTGANGRQYVEKCLRLIKPVVVQGEIEEQVKDNGEKTVAQTVKKACYSLGYNFVIPKPKELLVIIPDEVVDNSKAESSSLGAKETLSKADVENVHKILRRFGVGLITESELKSPEADMAYSYVLVREFAGDMQKEEWVYRDEFLKLPFRVLSARGNRPSHGEIVWVGEYTGSLYEELLEKLREILSNESVAEEFTQNLKAGVCCDWVRHIKRQRKLPVSDIPIIVDMYGDSGNSGQSLVTDSDLLRVAFENCFNAAIKSFFDLHKWSEEEYDTEADMDVGAECSEDALDEDDDKEDARRFIEDETHFKFVLATLLIMCPRAIDRSVNEMRVNSHVVTLIQYQLGRWCQMASEEIKEGTLRKWVLDYYEQRTTDEKNKMPIALRSILDDYLECNDKLPFEDVKNYMELGREWFNGAEARAYNDDDLPFVWEFIQYFEKAILEQARVFLSKYEERHITLPSCFSAGEYKRKGSEFWPLNGSQQVIFTANEAIKSKSGENCIAYWRHENFLTQRKRCPFYLEPLSGAQGYFNSFVQFAKEYGNDAVSNAKFDHFVVKLIETGLFRILLIDERVTKFVSEHANVATTFNHIGIKAIDDNTVSVKQLFDENIPCRNIALETDEKFALADFEILIIHQGIIDKLLPGHEDPVVVEEFIKRIVKEIRYVLITTGRGSPANIPSSARVLPFSVIENTLFKNYPEKMVLVDAVMNILPVSNKKNLNVEKTEVLT